MKQLILLFIALTLAPLCFSQTGTIRGHLHNTNNREDFVNANIYLVGTKTVTQSNLDGDFELNNIPIGNYELKIITVVPFTGLRQDSLLVPVKVNSDTIINLSIDFPPPCFYKKENTICPICHKKDKVVPIVYGLPRKKIMKKAKKGKLKLGGCMASDCDPYWYCKRDEKEF
jgi:hypothetical protein